MCGIIGAASSRSVGKILIKGLQLMEYRGYDSAGVVLNKDEEILRLRSLGNSVVPQCAAIPLQRVKDLYATTS